MKKAVMIALAIFFILGMRVYATDEISLSMHTEDELKAGKNFNVHLCLNSSSDIGCCRLRLSYGELELKSIFLENKKTEDILYYNDDNGQADIIYMPENLQDIILRFAPKDSDEKYTFEVLVYEACDCNGNYLRSDTAFEFSLAAAKDTEISQKSVPEKIRVRNEVSKKQVQASEITSYVPQEKEYSNEYRVVHEEKAASQTEFLIFGGVALIFAAGLAAVYKIGFKNGRHTEKKENP